MLTGASAINYRTTLFGAAGSGIVLQSVQGEDSTPSYEYFTIWSSVALILYATNLLSRWPVVQSYVRNAGSVGALFSAVVYLLAIAPVNGMGHEPVTVVANVVLHLVVPALVIALYASNRTWQLPPRAIVATLTFPAAYFGWSILSSTVGETTSVYVFLDVSRVGVFGVLGAAVGGAIGYFLVAVFLSWLTGRASANSGFSRSAVG